MPNYLPLERVRRDMVRVVPTVVGPSPITFADAKALHGLDVLGYDTDASGYVAIVTYSAQQARMAQRPIQQRKHRPEPTPVAPQAVRTTLSRSPDNKYMIYLFLADNTNQAVLLE